MAGVPLQLKRRRLLLAAAAACGAPAWAQPSAQPLRLIVGFPAGGGVDTVARLMGKALGDQLGRPVVVENRAGAGGQIGAQAVARAAADGNTLLMASPGPITVAPSLSAALPYDPVRDLMAVVPVVRISSILVTRPDFPARNMQELLEMARRSPNKLSFGSGGAGTALHLAGELVNHVGGLKLLHVPYKGTAPGLADAIAGHVDLFMSDPSAVPHVTAGKLRVLGITSAKPSAALPGYPVIADALPGYEADNWYGLLAPAHTPPAVVAQINAAVAVALRGEEMRGKLLAMGMEPYHSTPEAFTEFLRQDLEKWRTVIKAADIRVG